MPGKEDATPSWSGYIFQGEVALCKAIETINNLDDLNDSYCLKLEQDEDFSIKTSFLEVFQVKAYLSLDSGRMSKYKDVIEEMINKYYYSKTSYKNPDDGRKRIITYSLQSRKRPIKSCLITHKSIQDYEENLSSFLYRFNSIDFEYYRTIHGVYTVGNINGKLNNAISSFFNDPNLRQEDIDVKRIYCCQLISDLIKERHRTKTVKKIPFSEIIDWITEAPSAFNEKIAWYEINKMFLFQIAKEIEYFDLSNDDEKEMYNKLQNCLTSIERLPTKDIIQLINENITPHTKLESNNLRGSYAIFLDDVAIQSIIVRAIKEIKMNPNYKSLQFVKKINDEDIDLYQLTTDANEFNTSTASQRALLQEHCEKVYDNVISKDADFYITRHLNISKEKMKNEHLINVTLSPEVEDNIFGFKSIDETINDLNE